MKKNTKNEIFAIQEELWRKPFFKKLLRVQLAAPIAAAFARDLTPKQAASYGLKVADELLKMAGL